MSAKDQVLQLVNEFKNKNYLKDKTDAMGDSLLLGANLADEANERSKEATETTLAVQEKYKEQILAQNLNPNKDPELVDLREGYDTAGERIKKFENDTNEQLAQTEQDVSSIGVSALKFENLKKTVTDGFDWQPVVQAALDSIISGTVILPPFKIQIHSPIIVGTNKRLAGNYYGSTSLEIKQNVDGVVLKDTLSSIDNLEILVGIEGYTKSALVFATYTYGHVWKPSATKLVLRGNISTPSGNAISVKPIGQKGIIGLKIADVQFRGFENAVLIESKINGFDGWVNRAIIKDSWMDYCLNGLNTKSNLDDSIIENFCGQNSAGATNIHINHENGTSLVIRDSSMSDGGNIIIGVNAKNTLIDGGYTMPDKIKDFGFGTTIREGIESQYYNQYIVDKDNFMGNDITPKWKKTLTGSSVIKNKMDTSFNPYNFGVVLSTGATINSEATLDYGGVCPYNRFLPIAISFKVRISNVENSQSLMGLKSENGGNFKGPYWQVKNGNLVPTSFYEGTELTLPGIPLTNKPYILQILLNYGKVYFHMNGKYIGVINNYQAADYAPFFWIKNTQAENKDLIISEMYVRSSQYYVNPL